MPGLFILSANSQTSLFLCDNLLESIAAITISIHDKSGITRNTKAVFVPGGLNTPL